MLDWVSQDISSVILLQKGFLLFTRYRKIIARVLVVLGNLTHLLYTIMILVQLRLLRDAKDRFCLTHCRTLCLRSLVYRKHLPRFNYLSPNPSFFHPSLFNEPASLSFDRKPSTRLIESEQYSQPRLDYSGTTGQSTIFLGIRRRRDTGS